jgi:hypothetical protein
MGDSKSAMCGNQQIVIMVVGGCGDMRSTPSRQRRLLTAFGHNLLVELPESTSA